MRSGEWIIAEDKERRVERPKSITFYGVAIIAYGIYNLLGAGNYKQFTLMFNPLPTAAIVALYVFTVFYAISCLYCGLRILRLEDWARKLMVILTAISVTLGLLLNRLVIGNFKEFLLSEEAGIPPEAVGPVFTYTVIFVAIVTVFELSIIYFFTRPGVVQKFKRT